MPTPDFAAHRQRLLARLGPHEAVLLFGGHHHLRNGDAEFRYRPQSDIFWLTGWEDPGVAVFLRPGEEPLTMFVQPKNPEREIWTGFRPGPEGAVQDFGADVAYPMAELEEQLTRLLQGVEVLHYAFAQDPEHDAVLMSCIHKAGKAARKARLPLPQTFHSPGKLLHELRLFKSEDELAVMRHASRVTAQAHAEAMAFANASRTEFEVEALILHRFLHEGSTGAGYTTIVAGGDNANILHYIHNRAPLQEGDLVLIDAGCEMSYYTADVTRTFPVSGRFSPAQRQVYELVLAAQLASIEVCRPGHTVHDVHQASVQVLTAGMVELGLLSGEVKELIETEAYKKYYMHGTGHWLGLDVHDVGNYTAQGASRALEAGMVVTVEPGLYIRAADEGAPEALRGIGVRIEDDILITEGAPEVLTAAAPKTVAEVEAACAVSYSASPSTAASSS